MLLSGGFGLCSEISGRGEQHTRLVLRVPPETLPGLLTPGTAEQASPIRGNRARESPVPDPSVSFRLPGRLLRSRSVPESGIWPPGTPAQDRAA